MKLKAKRDTQSVSWHTSHKELTDYEADDTLELNLDDFQPVDGRLTVFEPADTLITNEDFEKYPKPSTPEPIEKLHEGWNDAEIWEKIQEIIDHINQMLEGTNKGGTK